MLLELFLSSKHTLKRYMEIMDLYMLCFTVIAYNDI